MIRTCLMFFVTDWMTLALYCTLPLSPPLSEMKLFTGYGHGRHIRMPTWRRRDPDTCGLWQESPYKLPSEEG